jgi:hypothetical protein
MALIIRGTGDFQAAPEGLHSAVCVDVIDKGLVETPWGEKHKVQLVWEIAQAMDDGRPFTVRKTYTASLHEKSNLHKDLKAWRGRAFTAEELAGFDIERIVGVACQVLIQHNERDGQVYANVGAVMKAAAGQKLAASGQYVRMKDRKPEPQPAAKTNGFARPVEDPIPF